MSDVTSAKRAKTALGKSIDLRSLFGAEDDELSSARLDLARRVNLECARASMAYVACRAFSSTTVAGWSTKYAVRVSPKRRCTAPVAQC